ncbi:MAG: hypothetical protein ACLR78_06065 [Roseburia sp.]
MAAISFPKSENSGLKNYTIQGTIADVRFTESSYPVTISVGEITWDAGTMKVSDYQGTLYGIQLSEAINVRDTGNGKGDGWRLCLSDGS